MTLAGLISPHFNAGRLSYFDRRTRLPLRRDALWKIESGVVRTLTYLEDGSVVTLGLWGTGDVVSQNLSKADPYYMECLTPVQATLLPLTELAQVNQALISQIQQSQTFLEILHTRPAEVALHKLLNLLAEKFGCAVEQGQLIQFHLTHQEIAETIGTTRVTVTRILKNFEQEGVIERMKRNLVITSKAHPFWYYEI